jgi:DNA polymerase IV (archaeal DinB-like DNA polymerase)
MSESIILHIDMDSFYASVEIRDDPRLVGRPVVIGSDPKGGVGRGVISTCSYEARALGLHSGMPISQAWQRCPDAVFLPVNRQKYLAVSEDIMEILHTYADQVEQVSIDEAYLDLSDCRGYEEAESRAVAIKAEIRERVNLGCSVGIAPGRAYAKIASDLKKPDGLVVVPPEKVPMFLRPLEISRIPGLGRRSCSALTALGITTIGDLSGMDIQQLQDIFGSAAVTLVAIASGRDRTGLREHAPRQSISREITFGSDTRDMTLITGAIDEMTASIVDTMKRKQIRGRTIGVKLRYQDFTTINRSSSVDHPIDDLRAIRTISCQIYQELDMGAPIRLIGVRISGLVHPDPVQRSLEDFFPI